MDERKKPLIYGLTAFVIAFVSAQFMKPLWNVWPQDRLVERSVWRLWLCVLICTAGGVWLGWNRRASRESALEPPTPIVNNVGAERLPFIIRDLLLAVIFIGVGLGCWPLAIFIMRWGRGDFDYMMIGFALLHLGSAFIGAGILAPFHEKRLGAILGVVALWAFQYL